MSTPTLTATEQRRAVGMRLPPPVLLGILAKLAVLLQFAAFGGMRLSWAGGLVGGALALASIALLATSTSLFKQAGTPVRPTSPTTTVVTTGPYRLSRNPMYLGLAGLTAGLGLALGSVCLVGAAALFVLLTHHLAVLPEERYLQRTHGEAYRRYCAQVRRWI
ncbi:methyltransferase family protein [Sphaerotilaceae bacterium SBD11-9]